MSNKAIRKFERMFPNMYYAERKRIQDTLADGKYATETHLQKARRAQEIVNTLLQEPQEENTIENTHIE